MRRATAIALTLAFFAGPLCALPAECPMEMGMGMPMDGGCHPSEGASQLASPCCCTADDGVPAMSANGGPALRPDLEVASTTTPPAVAPVLRAAERSPALAVRPLPGRDLLSLLSTLLI